MQDKFSGKSGSNKNTDHQEFKGIDLGTTIVRPSTSKEHYPIQKPSLNHNNDQRGLTELGLGEISLESSVSKKHALTQKGDWPITPSVKNFEGKTDSLVREGLGIDRHHEGEFHAFSANAKLNTPKGSFSFEGKVGSIGGNLDLFWSSDPNQRLGFGLGAEGHLNLTSKSVTYDTEGKQCFGNTGIEGSIKASLDIGFGLNTDKLLPSLNLNPLKNSFCSNTQGISGCLETDLTITFNDPMCQSKHPKDSLDLKDDTEKKNKHWTNKSLLKEEDVPQSRFQKSWRPSLLEKDERLHKRSAFDNSLTEDPQSKPVLKTDQPQQSNKIQSQLFQKQKNPYQSKLFQPINHSLKKERDNLDNEKVLASIDPLKQELHLEKEGDQYGNLFQPFHQQKPVLRKERDNLDDKKVLASIEPVKQKLFLDF